MPVHDMSDEMQDTRPKTRFSQPNLILNPCAGGGRAKNLLPDVMQFLEQAGLPVTPTIPSSPADARQAADDAGRIGCDLLICMGGDGMIRDMIPALVGTDVPLGIIPSGTGNDLSRALGISRDMRGAVETLRTGAVRSIDVGTLDGIYFANIASSGLDAAVAAEINRRKLGSGTVAYICALMRMLPGFRPAEFELDLDGRRVQFRGMLTAIANTSSYGGGMLIAPNASPSDGMFDIVTVEAMSKPEFLRCFPGVFSGKHISHPKVKAYRASKVAISADPPQPVMVDGDVLRTTPQVLEIIPGALKVIA